ncbi:MAG: hypothetical protein RLZZ418_270 [Pseudomonadota bacterium]|jgi:hypothetical protein
MTSSFGYPTNTQQALHFKLARHIQESDVFMQDPKMFNEKSKKIFEDTTKIRLGTQIQLDCAHYNEAQTVSGFVGTPLNSVVSQQAKNITYPVTLGEFMTITQVQISNNDIAWQYQDNNDYMISLLMNVNSGTPGNIAAKKYSYTTNSFRNSNQIYIAQIDRTANKVATPYLSNLSNFTTADPDNASSNFNIQTLGEKIARIVRVIGIPVNNESEGFGRINIISRLRFKKLASNQANYFTENLTMLTYHGSTDRFVEINKELYAMAEYEVMDNSLAFNDPKWALPSVNPDGTRGANNNGETIGAITLTGLTIDANTGNMTATINVTGATTGDVLYFGDTFYFDNRNYSFIRASTGLLSTAKTDMSITLAKPTGYVETDVSTHKYTSVGSVFTVNLVGQLRPFVTVGSLNIPANNDPNINVSVAIGTIAAITPANINAALTTLLTTAPNNVLIPLCMSREHVLTFKTHSHYEFSIAPSWVQPYANYPMGTSVDDNYMKFLQFVGNPDVIKSVPINVGYQLDFGSTNLVGIKDTQYVNVYTALTSSFDNYQLNQGAVALHLTENDILSY